MFKTPFFARVHVYEKSNQSSMLFDYEKYLFFEHLDYETECVDVIIDIFKDLDDVVKIDIDVYSAVSYHINANVEARSSILKLNQTHYYNR